jgi:hypothetical protein
MPKRKCILKSQSGRWFFDCLMFFCFTRSLCDWVFFRFRLSGTAVTNRYRTLFLWCIYLSVLQLFLKCIICRLQVVSFKFKKYFVNGIHDGFSLFVDSCCFSTTSKPADFSLLCSYFHDANLMEAILCTILASNRFLQNVVLICERASRGIDLRTRKYWPTL